MKKLLVICGPTATGKTGLGIKLAKALGGEIVSADSRQVYIGMDIGTGKDISGAKFKIRNSKFEISGEQYRLGYYVVDRVKIWLLDVVEPSFRFTVADYVDCAQVVIKDIWRRKKLPIVVGGTGFYIKTLIDGVSSIGILPDLRLREKLEKKPVRELQKELTALDPFRIAKMNVSDRQNPRRLVRAIEIAHWRLENPVVMVGNARPLGKLDYFLVGLKAPFKKLYQRIDKRVADRINEGLEKEIKALLAQGYNWRNSALGETLGYQEWQEYFREPESQRAREPELRKRVIERWRFNEHRYARAQMTWFKKDKRVHWFEITQKGFDKEVQKLVQRWYYSADDQKN